MKQHAQAILQFTGYPLEPIVALQLNKSYQSNTSAGNALPVTAAQQNSTYNTGADDVWFGNYE